MEKSDQKRIKLEQIIKNMEQEKLDRALEILNTVTIPSPASPTTL